MSAFKYSEVWLGDIELIVQMCGGYCDPSKCQELLTQHSNPKDLNSNAPVRKTSHKIMGSTFTYWLIKIMTSSYCMKEVELLTFHESFFLLLSYVVCWVLHAAASTTVHCQPSICLSDQEHRIGNCVVCWAIVTCLDIAGKRCVLWCVCAAV